MLKTALAAGCSALALAPAAVSAQPGSGDPEALLRRHAPVYRYHSGERHLAMAVVDRPGSPPLGGGSRVARVHGRAVRRTGGGLWLQYWSFLAYNSQDRGVTRTGRHEGDWELVQLRLGAGGRPEAATYAQHSSAERCPWSRVERAGPAPVVYVANGSHAAHYRAGVHDRPFPDPNDESDGSGRRIRPSVEVISENRPRWVAWPGRFGGSRAGLVPGEQDSPRGPRFQRPWREPAAFEQDARDCGADPPGHPVEVWLLLGGLGAALVLVLRQLSRRRAA